ncbi:glycosyltransferase [Alteromonas sp. W364]|uniref:glycosyltransferase n=1 Tax=Alteromonas sp. W364 TaxID=3075610 RepID=UPI0028879AE3|nr:glycosyltransferase [Alteromonas sp. W364]MDT0627741.1 glycosyltransferase [Alteromonas sp. W364]
MYLVNFSNQYAAGPKNIALNFLKNACSSDHQFVFLLPDLQEFRAVELTSNVKVVFVKKRFGVLGAMLNALLVNKLYIPNMLKKNKVAAILAFGNFLASETNTKKIVLLHHPYLVDEELFQRLPIVQKLIEKLKRMLFKKTVANVDKVIVQSTYMEKKFLEKYPNDKGKTKIIPNPLSAKLTKSKAVLSEKETQLNHKFRILYVSRFYPHKNHSFLVRLSDELNLKGFRHEIRVTVDHNLPGAQAFLSTIQNRESIENIGEVEQSSLQAEYLSADLFIFPSKSETFGNPIIEAMFYACPLMLPNLEYAIALADGAAEFYNPDDVLECCNKIMKIGNNSAVLDNMRERSKQQGLAQIDADEWFDIYLQQLSE